MHIVNPSHNSSATPTTNKQHCYSLSRTGKYPSDVKIRSLLKRTDAALAVAIQALKDLGKYERSKLYVKKFTANAIKEISRIYNQ